MQVIHLDLKMLQSTQCYSDEGRCYLMLAI